MNKEDTSRPLVGWRYHLRTPPEPCGSPFRSWANIIMTPDGYFAAVSDYANCAFHWGAHGMEEPKDFRFFWLKMWNEQHYFCSKMGKQDYFDKEETVKDLREKLLTWRREGTLSKEGFVTERDLLKELEEGEITHIEWCRQTDISDAWDEIEMAFEPDLAGLARIFLPLLADAIRAELEAEGKLAPRVAA